MSNLKLLILAVVIVSASLNSTNCSKGARVASLAVTPLTGTMANGSTSIANGTNRQLVATATLTDGSQFNFTSVVDWSSSDESVATVDLVTKGSVSAVTSLTTNQTATITAIDTVNHVSASIGINVTTPSSIIVSPANPYMHFGAIHLFSAIASFPNTTATQDVTSFSTWTVQPIGLASVTNLIVGVVGGGLVSIPVLATTPTLTTATIESAFNLSPLPSGTTLLTITNVPISSVTVTAPSFSISLNTAQSFSAIGNYPVTAATPTADFTSSVTWLSSNTTVATISSTGTVSGIAAGATTITAIDPITNFYGQASVNITQ